MKTSVKVVIIVLGILASIVAAVITFTEEDIQEDGVTVEIDEDGNFEIDNQVFPTKEEIEEIIEEDVSALAEEVVEKATILEKAEEFLIELPVIEAPTVEEVVETPAVETPVVEEAVEVVEEILEVPAVEEVVEEETVIEDVTEVESVVGNVVTTVTTIVETKSTQEQ